MGNAFVTGFIATIPAVFLYVMAVRRIDETFKVLDDRIRRVDDRVDYLAEEVYDIPRVPTQTLSTSAPAVMVSAPVKKKRVRKVK